MVAATSPATQDIDDIFNDFAIDTKQESEGTWVTYKTSDFLIARTGNKAYRKQISHQYKKHGRMLDSGTDAAEAKSEAILIDVMASTILLGWRGKVALKGEVMEYNKENAKRLLAIPLFREWVNQQASDQASYKAVKDAEDEKN